MVKGEHVVEFFQLVIGHAAGIVMGILVGTILPPHRREHWEHGHVRRHASSRSCFAFHGFPLHLFRRCHKFSKFPSKYPFYYRLWT